jgi:hypothetical protein
LFAKNRTLTKAWARAFIGPHLDTRMIVLRAHLQKHIDMMKSVVAGKFSKLVFNLDEICSSDWDDRKAKNVFVPRSVSPDDVYHPVSRRYGHGTLLACPSAAGDTLTPMVISGAPTPDFLGSQGLRQYEDVMSRHRQPAYVDENLFYEYISHVFVPYGRNIREKSEFANETAV